MSPKSLLGLSICVTVNCSAKVFALGLVEFFVYCYWGVNCLSYGLVRVQRMYCVLVSSVASQGCGGVLLP